MVTFQSPSEFQFYNSAINYSHHLTCSSCFQLTECAGHRATPRGTLANICVCTWEPIVSLQPTQRWKQDLPPEGFKVTGSPGGSPRPGTLRDGLGKCILTPDSTVSRGPHPARRRIPCPPTGAGSPRPPRAQTSVTLQRHPWRGVLLQGKAGFPLRVLGCPWQPRGPIQPRPRPRPIPQRSACLRAPEDLT